VSATHVLICGTSTRAAAESAAHAGFQVTAIDAFADLDQHPAVRALSIRSDFGLPPTARAAVRAARGVASDTVAYLSGFENHPAAVRALAAGRTLWGNAPEVLRRVRNPACVAEVLQRHGLAVPEVRLKPDTTSGDWLVKPRASGGGQRIHSWRGEHVGRRSYLQQRIDGTPGSISFVAAGGDVVPLAMSRQLVGDARFGATGYRYCGSILAAPGDAQFPQGAALFDRACLLARVVAREFQLTGVNGIDFIAQEGMPYPIEVNPRWSSSMELVERKHGVPVFGLHAAACTRLELPRFDASAAGNAQAVGKAIVFARADVTAGDTRAWLSDPTVRDVPHPGERFTPGQPICSVFAAAPDARGCYDALVARAERIYAALSA
jgi:predicted ATP-grasp superfamily ATP-dependent carboligase